MRSRVFPRIVGIVLATAVVAVAVLFVRPVASSAAASRLDTGVVDIETNLAFEGAAAAGTGVVVSSNQVLTNNHVIRGATAIRVRDVVSGRTYRAIVLGYNVSADVALLKVTGARLTPATIGTTTGVRVGDAVTAVGNARGAGGTPSVATGRVTALHQSITVGDGRGGFERLSDLIRTNAPLEPGYSGGPLLSDSGRVIGIDTAASASFVFDRGSVGFAIPIDRAVRIVRLITSGRSSTAVHVGPTAFLGVRVTDAGDEGSGALVEEVVSGSPAERAGINAGDVVVSFNGHSISSPTVLTSLLMGISPGTASSVRWLDRFGSAHTATVRPVAGPPQ
jgi:S1-C subfamily serine protease